jgi:predicted NACHT family NTPase
VEEDWLAREHFTEADLIEMRQADILTFIDHWHAAVAAELQDDEEKVALPDLAASLKKVVLESRSIRHLTGSPLLCALVCALHRDRHRQIPKDRIELYEACCAMLLERRDAERHIQLGDYPLLTYRQKRVLLEDLAYWMLRNGRAQANRSAVDSCFQTRLNGMRDVSPKLRGRPFASSSWNEVGCCRNPHSIL